jgi:hypothetical protein
MGGAAAVRRAALDAGTDGAGTAAAASDVDCHTPEAEEADGVKARLSEPIGLSFARARVSFSQRLTDNDRLVAERDAVHAEVTSPRASSTRSSMRQ